MRGEAYQSGGGNLGEDYGIIEPLQFEYDEDKMSQVVEEFYSPSMTETEPMNCSVASKLKENLGLARMASG